MRPEDVQHLTKPLKESSLAEDPEDVEDLTNPLEEPTSVETKAALFSFGGGHLRALCELVGLLVLVFVSTQRSSNISSSSSGGPPVVVEGDCIRGKPAAFGSHPFFSPVVEDPYNLLVSRYRLQLGEVSVDLLEEEVRLRARNETFIDIGSFVDLVNDMIDNIGIRGVWDDVFNLPSLAVAMQEALARRRLAPQKIQAVIFDSHQGPDIKFYGRMPGQVEKKKLKLSFWWKHWVGAIIADKFVREGSLLLVSDNDPKHDGERIGDDAATYFREIKRITSDLKYPNLYPYHSVHGFWWQYVAATRPGMKEYPADLLDSFCAPWKDEEDYNEYVKNSMHRECKHGIGHAVFYTMYMRQVGAKSLNVRKQRLDGTFSMSNETTCEAVRFCEGARGIDIANNDLAYHGCAGGLAHSIRIFDKSKDNVIQEELFKAACAGSNV